MDSLITAAAQALAKGDPLGALNRVALRDDAPALALRGIAMAQLGDFARAKLLLRRAGRAFGLKEAVARARCTVAEAEVALAARDLGWAPGRLDEAASVLETHDDRANAAHARLLDIRRLLLIGRLDHAGERLVSIDLTRLPAALQAIHGLASAGIALRRMEVRAARIALEGARDAAGLAGIPALIAEVDAARRLLQEPAARLIADGAARPLLLDEIEDLQGSAALIVDACRHGVRDRGSTVSLATRPVLFALLRALAEAWPQDAPRDVLIAKAFGSRFTDESHRARLRVEIGRLRAALRQLARISATERGFVIAPHRATGIAVLARPVEEKHATVLALMADGETWSSSALALALGSSQRSVQRALDTLAEAGKVQSFGQARARRWVMPPMPGFATSLLLPVSWPDG
ncbi:MULTISPECIES: helix-turn-helix domain-containing protein [Bosea]|uniref:helix-turn-helix domain-containing protein n=1 Tax=Bosea TaxID=85413 RepID=UPI0021503506|nr:MULTISPECIES: helix-turn-helix domain-containing protein [Bosea]MCR4524572.1 helix-turn-helix domain-containing protein [Bosea sp. 47.2.35]MDR6829979.1 DNA-binding transcriptional ArsR family regulator [Bosea robiniae]MDR6896861.1 DNA-binding transcriptional ArsR family regulator [Bosea sp. BE109]MDR7140117.1 DNA-binding transcriptional ArsR family regulator [Bosea sp. BE168]MDR7176814.1 DNA-binding transcriptional ArsR family regulator [Bosea sp. BE271]